MVVVAAVAAAVVVGSAIFNFFQQKKAKNAREQAFILTELALQKKEEARKVQSRLERLKLARQRRAVAREARQKRGQALQAGATSGASISSAAVAGGIGGAESVAAASESFLAESGIRTQEISDFLGEAAIFESQAARKGATATGASQLGTSVQTAGAAAGEAISIFAK